MIYTDGIWVRENICDLAPDRQTEIRAEVTDAYRFFGYEGQRLERAVAKAMDSDLADVCNLLGAYEWAKDNK